MNLPNRQSKGVTFHNGEAEPLLGGDSNGERMDDGSTEDFQDMEARADSDGYFPSSWRSGNSVPSSHAHLPIFNTIHRMRKDIREAIGMSA